MQQLSIQCPDGKYHTVNVNRFYSVIKGGYEVFVLEYDDLTINSRNCFSILEKENDTFVVRPLENPKEYKAFYASIRFTPKRIVNSDLLPWKVDLTSGMALPQTPPSIDATPKQKKRKISNRGELIIFKDVDSNHENYPFYLDASTANILKLTRKNDGYHHLTPVEFEELRKKFDIILKEMKLSLGVKKTNPGQIDPQPTVPVNNQPKKNVVVYEDRAEKHQEHPYYLSKNTALSLGFRTNLPYYHLSSAELEDLKNKYHVNIKKIYLGIIDTNAIKPSPVVPQSEPVGLTEEEKVVLEQLFENLIDFEDYYQFFGFQDKRDASPEEILNSPAMKELERVLNKGIASGNYIAVNLMEFLEGFKEELNQKKITK